MTKLTVLNKKTNQEGTAVELADGRFEVTIEGETKTVAASTMKRWYKVTGEVAVETEKVAAPAVELTENEVAILNAMRNNEYNDALEAPTWTFTAIDNSGLAEKAARGVISSLIKKGLVVVEEDIYDDSNTVIGFTAAGEKLFDTADGEDCDWGGPKLLSYTNAKPSKQADELDELLQDAEVVAEEAKAPEAKQPEAIQTSLDGVTIQQLETRGGKCEKLLTTIQYGESVIEIIEYNGYVCDVVVTTGEQTYKSPKMSIKDALENGLGLEGDSAKAAKKVIMQARKAAKAAINA